MLGIRFLVLDSNETTDLSEAIEGVWESVLVLNDFLIPNPKDLIPFHGGPTPNISQLVG